MYLYKDFEQLFRIKLRLSDKEEQVVAGESRLLASVSFKTFKWVRYYTKRERQQLSIPYYERKKNTDFH